MVFITQKIKLEYNVRMRKQSYHLDSYVRQHQVDNLYQSTAR